MTSVTKPIAAVAVTMAIVSALSLRAQTPVEQPFPLVDEASKDLTFAAFRTQLIDIVERRDVASLLAVTSPQIMYSFGAGPGIAGFRNEWHLTDEKSELWPVLAQVLSLGGTFQGTDIFVAPYVYSKWPAELSSDEDYVAIVRNGTPIYAEPKADAPILRRLDPTILLTEYDDKLVGEWHRLLLLDGQKGYVAHRDARRPVDLRAFFARTDTGWQMVICIAGD